MQQLQNIIETAFERRAEITPANADTVTREAVNQVIALLDSGALRVAEKIDGQWVTHQLPVWLPPFTKGNSRLGIRSRAQNPAIIIFFIIGAALFPY